MLSTGPATGSSLRTHGDKKTAIIILFIMMAVTYSILSYTFHLFRRINYYFYSLTPFLCISMIFYSLSYMFIQIYYSCFFTHINNIFKYVVFCSILSAVLFYRPVYIFSVCSILPNLLYRPFIYYNKGLFSGNFYLPYH